MSDTSLAEREAAWLHRARRDFRFFSRSLKIRIKDERDGSGADGLTGPFIWRPAQEIVWAWMCQQIEDGVPVYLVILKARQFGISTFFCAWLFWQMWRTMSVRTMVAVANKGTSMNALMETMDRFYQSLPEGFRPGLRAKGAERISKEEIYFSDRKSGGYFVAAEKKDAARGDAFDHAFCTEIGSYSRAADFFGEFVPAMGERKNTTLVLESTAAPGYFRERYIRAEKQNKAIFLPYSVAPEMYSRKLFVDHEGRRKVWRDELSEEVVSFTKADRAEMAFLSKQHEAINDRCGRKILGPMTEEQMWWWHWYCDHKMDGDEDYMRQEFPRDDISAFERGAISAFKICLPIVRASIESAPEECPEYSEGVLHAASDLEDTAVDQHQIVFTEMDKRSKFWQEREPGIEIYQWPKDGFTYTIGVDVADDIETAQDEDDANFSVICVYCADAREQVAEWRGSIDPHDLGDEVAKIGYFYNTALVCVEYNNMGITTIDRLVKYLEYPNRFKWPLLDEAGKFHKKKEMWVTDHKTKQLMIGSLRHAIKTQLFKVRSPGLYEELMGYQNKDGSYQPGPDTFADRIIAAALAWQGVEQTDYGMDKVLGFREEAKAQTSANQAKRYLSQVNRSPVEPPPQQLPFEVDEDSATQAIDESWIFASAGL